MDRGAWWATVPGVTNSQTEDSQTELGEGGHYLPDRYRIKVLPKDFPGGLDGKASVYNVGDLGSIPGLGRSPGEGNGNPFQYSCLENPMDRGAW